MRFYSEANIRRVFVVSVALKALDGLGELVLGVAVLFTSTTLGVIQALTRRELIEDPHDLVAHALRQLVPLLTSSRYFVAVYLLSHGVVKILLVAGLLRDKLWAYPAAVAVFSLFIAYQLYRYLGTHSVWLLVLTALDLFIIVLTWHEYHVLKAKSARAAAG